MSNKDAPPIIAEFDIDVESKQPSQTNEMLLEEFSLPLIVNIHKLYISLQNESIADPNASKTKTEYACGYVQGNNKA